MLDRCCVTQSSGQRLFTSCMVGKYFTQKPKRSRIDQYNWKFRLTRKKRKPSNRSKLSLEFLLSGILGSLWFHGKNTKLKLSLRLRTMKLSASPYRIYMCEVELIDILTQIGDSNDFRGWFADFHTDPIQYSNRMVALLDNLWTII
jgi:hypothetical protein